MGKIWDSLSPQAKTGLLKWGKIIEDFEWLKKISEEAKEKTKK